MRQLARNFDDVTFGTDSHTAHSVLEGMLRTNEAVAFSIHSFSNLEKFQHSAASPFLIESLSQLLKIIIKEFFDNRKHITQNNPLQPTDPRSEGDPSAVANTRNVQKLLAITQPFATRAASQIAVVLPQLDLKLPGIHTDEIQRYAITL